jgi:magnesium chelatase subunit I
VGLVYEGRAGGAAFVAQNLIESTITFFQDIFKIEEVGKPNEKTTYSDLIEWFFFCRKWFSDCLMTADERILFEGAFKTIVPLEILIKKVPA